MAEQIAKKHNTGYQGYQYEDDVEKELIKLQIPYKKNIKIQQKNGTMCEFDFLIPNGIIEVKTRSLYDHHEHDIIKVENQIERYKKIIKDFKLDNFKIYFLLPNSSKTFSDIIMIKSCNEIPVHTYKYFCDKATVIRSICSSNNLMYDVHKQLFQNNFYTPLSNYNQSICIMNDDEINKIDQLNPIFVDKLTGDYIQIVNTNNHKYNRKKWHINNLWDHNAVIDNLFHQFYYFIDKISLVGSEMSRSPCRLIDGTTTRCKDCKSIIFVNRDCIVCKHT